MRNVGNLFLLLLLSFYFILFYFILFYFILFIYFIYLFRNNVSIRSLNILRPEWMLIQTCIIMKSFNLLRNSNQSITVLCRGFFFFFLRKIIVVFMPTSFGWYLLYIHSSKHRFIRKFQIKTCKHMLTMIGAILIAGGSLENCWIQVGQTHLWLTRNRCIIQYCWFSTIPFVSIDARCN